MAADLREGTPDDLLHPLRGGASFVLAALIGVAGVVPVRWRVCAKRVWSYLVYCLGFRLLALQLDGTVVGTVVTFGVKHAATARI